MIIRGTIPTLLTSNRSNTLNVSQCVNITSVLNSSLRLRSRIRE